jgi:ferredoxin-NADP reductase
MTPAASAELELKVRSREHVGEGVVALSLVDRDGATLPPWSPGAHIDLLLDDTLVRQYSLCGAPEHPGEWRIGVLLDPDTRGGSRFVHERLERGTPIRARGPRNHFPLLDAPRYQFIAGGIGITPIMPMIAAAAARGADWHLLYGGRTRASMAFLEELAVHGDRVAVRPQDEHGLLDLNSTLCEPRDGTLVYCCGPEALLIAVEEACAAWPPGSLRVERFAAATPTDPDPDALESFEVVCQQSGVTASVDAGQSIVDALEVAGVNVFTSCCEGVCGTCETVVIAGEPEHRDSVLGDDERESANVMMICVSRSRSDRLVLDL